MLELGEPLNLWLRVRSLDRAKEFYGTKLGLPLWREEPGEALHFGAAGGMLSLHLAGDGDLPPRGSRLVFTVEADLTAVCDELHRRGIDLEKPLADRPFGRSAMFRDPDGHELWVVRPSATETQFLRWRVSRRRQARPVPVRPPPKVRRHEPEKRSRRRRHPSE